MEKPQWPGIATTAVVVLAATIIVAGARDDFRLKEWQPLLAALVALGGGAFAYNGAMAKVRHDERESSREFLRRQLGLYLKVYIAIDGFQPIASQIEARMTFTFSTDQTLRVEEVKLREPAEIEEAWDNLDVFPRRIIREIASIRENIRRVDTLLEGLPADRMLKAGEKGSQTRFDVIHDHVAAVADACTIVYEVLDTELKRLAPSLPDHERMLALFGEPGPEQ